jgi:DNA-binding transcriptional LysR family regulator
MEDSMHGLLRAASSAAEVSEKVRVSAPPALTSWLLAPRLQPALYRLPGIELDLRAEARETDLMRRESDIALRYNRPTAPGLAVRGLATVTYRLCASEAYLAQRTPEQWGGVAVLPDYFPAAGLVEIASPVCPVKRKLWIVMHEDVRRAAPVRAVADEIIALFTSGE